MSGISELMEQVSGEQEALEDVGEVDKRIEQGLERFKREKFESETDRYESIMKGIGDWLGERSEDARELAGAAREMLKNLKLDGPVAENIVGGLEKASELTKKGAEVLQGEKAEGLIQLLALAFLIILKPEAGLEFIGQHPELLTNAIKMLGA